MFDLCDSEFVIFIEFFLSIILMGLISRGAQSRSGLRIVRITFL